MNSASTRFGEGEFVVRATAKYTSVPVSTSHRAPETLDKIWSRCALLHSVWPTYVSLQLRWITEVPDTKGTLSPLLCFGYLVRILALME